MGQSTRGAGVLLSVRWGDQDLAHEFFPLGVPNQFKIGSGPGCDFVCGGSKAFQLLEVDEEGASFSAPKNGPVRVARRGEAWTTSEAAVSLERGDEAAFDFGPLTFAARVLDAPPAVSRGAAFEFTTVNTALVLAAAFGFFAVSAANRDLEGAELDDGLGEHSARLVKSLIEASRPRAASAAAASTPTPKKNRPAPSALARARTAPTPRPQGRPTSQVVDVGAIFRGPGALKLLGHGPGLGEAIDAASGLNVAMSGDGLGGLGVGRGADGSGLGGMALEGIGRLGTHGRGGEGKDPYGVGMALKPMEKPRYELPQVDITTCQSEGGGCLDKELIRRVIHQNLAGYRFCFESLLNRFPSLEGKVSIKFSIAQSGKVTEALVGASTANNPELEQCVGNRTRLLHFPASRFPGLVVVTYPFIFKQAGK